MIDIYEQMTEHLEKVQLSIDNYPLPKMIAEMITKRKHAIELSELRAQDSISQHLSWGFYHHSMLEHVGGTMDPVIWEMLYQELTKEQDIFSPASLHALMLTVDASPSKMCIVCEGMKEMKVDGKTTPEFVALAHDMKLNIQELNPPIVGISLEDVPVINELIGAILGPDHDIFTLMDNAHTGADVNLS
jgi:hypothetical protein